VSFSLAVVRAIAGVQSILGRVRSSVLALDPSARMAPNGHFKPNFNEILAFDLKHKNKTKSNK
jgi:hypothetical protein